MGTQRTIPHHRESSKPLGYRQRSRTLLIACLFPLLVMLGSAGQLSAADDCTGEMGNEPTTPYTPIDTWIALPAGEHHWYAFRDEGDGTDIRVRMTTVPANGATFRVYTTAQLIALRRGEAVEPVGAGAPLPALNDDLYWTGNFVQSGIYYVLVESTNQPVNPAMRSYMLTIQGAGVSFPLLSFTKPRPPTTDAYATCSFTDPTPPPTTPIPAATPATVLTSSPQAPLPAIGRLVQIAPEERHWYAFRDEGDDATIEIRADATPNSCLTFALWTPEQLDLWQRNQPFQPVGRGTPNEALNIDRFWTGSFVKSGTYYIVVERDPAAAGTCTYQLRVTGDDVSLILPGQRTP